MDLRALLIEDDELCARALARTLVRHGIPTDVVSTARDARTRFAGSPYPVVIADFGLPGDETGFGLLRYVHDNFPSTRCILISGSRQAASLPKEDWFTFLSKPFSSDALLRAIQAQTTEVHDG